MLTQNWRNEKIELLRILRKDIKATHKGKRKAVKLRNRFLLCAIDNTIAVLEEVDEKFNELKFVKKSLFNLSLALINELGEFLSRYILFESHFRFSDVEELVPHLESTFTEALTVHNQLEREKVGEYV